VSERRKDPDISVHRDDPRVRRPAKLSPDAVDDELVRAVVREAGAWRGPGRRTVSVSRVHDYLVTKDIRWPVKELHNIDFVSCDLAGSRINGGFLSRVTITECTLHRVVLGPFEANKVTIRDCQFDHVTFGGPTYSSFRKTEIVGSSFTACDLREVTFRDSDLRDVIFDKPRTARTSFHSTRLDGVTFIGSMRTLFFIDSALSNVDFTDTRPDDLIFTGSDLRDVRFPMLEDCFAVLRPTMYRVVREVVDRLSSSGRKELAMIAEAVDEPPPGPVIIGADRLGNLDGEDRKRVLDALRPHAISAL